jgi:gamma-glutamyl:cysteine ligase YbdK (ATP-grasp superfamily)
LAGPADVRDLRFGAGRHPNSPVWGGQATGLCLLPAPDHFRLPALGPPPHFDSYEEYAAVIDQLVASGSIED